jgi:hypothetical protein
VDRDADGQDAARGNHAAGHEAKWSAP